MPPSCEGYQEPRPDGLHVKASEMSSLLLRLDELKIRVNPLSLF